MEHLISINIVNNKNNDIINKYPILFYWDYSPEYSFIDFIKQSDEFYSYIKNRISSNQITNLSYHDLSLYICYYNDDNLIEKNISLQDIIALDKLDDFWVKYICEYFKTLYINSFKTEPIKYKHSDTSLIIFIYQKLMSKYSSNRINDIIVINYIMSKIKEDFVNLNEYNTNIIKENLVNLFKRININNN